MITFSEKGEPMHVSSNGSVKLLSELNDAHLFNIVDKILNNKEQMVGTLVSLKVDETTTEQEKQRIYRNSCIAYEAMEGYPQYCEEIVRRGLIQLAN